MQNTNDITKTTIFATEGVDFRTVFENDAAHACACDFTEFITHYTERDYHHETPHPETKQGEPNYDEDGMRPHN